MTVNPNRYSDPDDEICFKKYRSISDRHKHKAQIKADEKLIRDGGVIIPDIGCGLPKLIAYQKYLAKAQIALKDFYFKDFRKARDEAIYEGGLEITNTGSEIKKKKITS